MKITLTIKLSATSRDELIHTFARDFKAYMPMMEELRDKGMFGPPDQVELRCLIETGSWREELKDEVLPETS